MSDSKKIRDFIDKAESGQLPKSDLQEFYQWMNFRNGEDFIKFLKNIVGKIETDGGPIYIGDHTYNQYDDGKFDLLITAVKENKEAIQVLIERVQEPSYLSNCTRQHQISDCFRKLKIDLQKIDESLKRLSIYKNIHDQLHHLEFYCYGPLIQISKVFPTNITLGTLEQHYMTLEQVTGNIVNCKDTYLIDEVTFKFFLDNLQLAEQELYLAIQDRKKERLKKTIWLLSRVLGTQPSRINSCLTNIANGLSFSSLNEAIHSFERVQYLSQSKFKEIQKTKSAIIDLINLKSTLDVLISRHDAWQLVDIETRRIEANLSPNNNYDLKESWSDLKSQVQALYSESPQKWVLSFQKKEIKLDTILNKQEIDYEESILHFNFYRRYASNCFFQVDKELKGLCDRLVKVGNPLLSIIEILYEEN